MAPTDCPGGVTNRRNVCGQQGRVHLCVSAGCDRGRMESKDSGGYLDVPTPNVFLLAFILGRFSPRPAAGVFLWSRENIPQVAFHTPRLLASFNTSSQRLSRLRRSTPWLLADFTRKFFVPDSALGVSRSTTYVESSSQPVGLPDSSPLGADRSTLIRGLPRT